MVTPPPALKLSPIVIGAPYSRPELRSSGSSGWGSKLAIGTNHGILSDRNGTNIQHGQIVIGIEIFSYMDVDPIIPQGLDD